MRIQECLVTLALSFAVLQLFECRSRVDDIRLTE